MAKKIFALEHGHGGTDEGAVGSGLLEKFADHVFRFLPNTKGK